VGALLTRASTRPHPSTGILAHDDNHAPFAMFQKKCFGTLGSGEASAA
jgi:hypothetical protein